MAAAAAGNSGASGIRRDAASRLLENSKGGLDPIEFLGGAEEFMEKDRRSRREIFPLYERSRLLLASMGAREGSGLFAGSNRECRWNSLLGRRILGFLQEVDTPAAFPRRGKISVEIFLAQKPAKTKIEIFNSQSLES